MVDQRYSSIKRYVDSLSKWVRTGVQHNRNCQDVMAQLSFFQEEMNEMDRNHKDEIAQVICWFFANFLSKSLCYPRQ